MLLRNKRILVTGAYSFFGLHTTEILVKQDVKEPIKQIIEDGKAKVAVNFSIIGYWIDTGQNRDYKQANSDYS